MESLTPTDEVVVPLLNGYKIRSGWIDKDDPDRLPAGDYIAVESAGGVVVFYEDAADLFADPVTGRQKLNEMLQACIASSVADKLVEFYAYEETGYGRGPVGLEPIFRAIDTAIGERDGRQQVVGEGELCSGSPDGPGDGDDQPDGQVPPV